MLTSTQNPLVKSIRKLHQGKYRRLHQQFLLEGTHLVQAALQAGYPLEVVCYTPSPGQSAMPIFSPPTAANSPPHGGGHRGSLASPGHNGTPRWCSRRCAPAPTYTTNHNYPGAHGRNPAGPGQPGDNHSHRSLPPELKGSGSAKIAWHPIIPRFLRASAGQWFRLPTMVCHDLEQTLSQWQPPNIQIVAACADGDVDYWTIDFF